jgi:hypothetical protein
VHIVEGVEHRKALQSRQECRLLGDGESGSPCLLGLEDRGLLIDITDAHHRVDTGALEESASRGGG